MDIKTLSLTDFSSEELSFLYLVLDEKRKDFHSKMEIVEKFEAGTIKDDLYKSYLSMLGNCTQWQTKIDEAQKFVIARRIMTQDN